MNQSACCEVVVPIEEVKSSFEIALCRIRGKGKTGGLPGTGTALRRSMGRVNVRATVLLSDWPREVLPYTAKDPGARTRHGLKRSFRCSRMEVGKSTPGGGLHSEIERRLPEALSAERYKQTGNRWQRVMRAACSGSESTRTDPAPVREPGNTWTQGRTRGAITTR